MEINPFIRLRKELKDCPPESWDETTGELITEADGELIPSLEQLVQASRRADQVEALAKIAVCERLGMTVTAWKDDGYAVYATQSDALLSAIHDVRAQSLKPNRQWAIHVRPGALENSLLDQSAFLFPGESSQHAFYPL
jgi:hypothetical protein